MHKPQNTRLIKTGILILLALLILGFTFAQTVWSPSPTIQGATPPPPILPTVNTPFPKEILENYEQTNGVVFGGVILVLIIIGGTLSVISRKPDKKNH